MFGEGEIKQSKTVKIAFWYTFSNLLVSALSFISTPVFSRLLSKEEYGQFSKFSSWMSIVQIVITFNFSATIARAKYDYEEDMNSYLATLVAFNSATSLVVFVLVVIFPSFFEKVFSMDIRYIRIMLLYMFFYPSFSFLQIKHRIFRKYKFFAVFSISTAVLRTGISLVCVLFMNDKLYGRIVGDILSMSAFCMMLWIVVLRDGKQLKFEYIRYALTIAVPLIPHTLAGNILTTADKIMITSICGAEENAIYSLAYTISCLAAILWNSMNQAWSPWLYDNMALENRNVIKEKSRLFLGTFAILILGMLLIAPEIVWIMGGEKYYESRFLMPPVILACVFQFVYGMYVNIEIFVKKTFQISVGTMSAGAINIVLNYLLIPKYGYQAAAYTTLIGYALLCAFHYLMVKKGKKYDDIYDGRFIREVLIFLSFAGMIALVIYNNNKIRFVLILVYIVAFLSFILKFRKQIVEMIK